MQQTRQQCSAWASSPGKRHHTGGYPEAGARLTIPQHVWCWVAQYSSVTDFAAVLQCSTRLLDELETEALWHYYAMVNEYATLLPPEDYEWVYLLSPNINLERTICWQRLVQINFKAPHSPAASVRIGNLCLKVPLRQSSSADALLTTIQKMLCSDIFSEENSSDRGTSGSSQPAGGGRAMRLRHMQWGGRPGLEVARDELFTGDGHHLALEFSLPGSLDWPLPPRCRMRHHRDRKQSCGWAFTGRLLAPPFQTCFEGVPGARGHHSGAMGTTVGAQLMIRVKSALLPNDVWLSMGGQAPLSALYEELGRVFHQENALVADAGCCLRFQLQEAQRSSAEKPLRQLMWAQCETIRVEFEGRAMAMLRKVYRRQPRRAFSGSDVDADASDMLTAYVLREQAFCQGSEDLPDMPFLSQVSGRTLPWDHKPLLRRGAESEMRSLRRQVSEPVASTSVCVLPRQVSEPAPQVLQREAGPCETIMALSDEEDALSEIPSESIRPEEHSASTFSSAPSPAMASSRDLEPIAPHYPPVLVPGTLRVRQFEFHPSLPDVILTGDKQGRVNAIDVESDAVHPALQVGVCPVLALSWMRHHPQYAVCGASHTGTIEFFKYSPDAPPNQPSLRCISALEEFPKLSSLSLNCTDDFLLASGISPNLAVYDVHTGKVLQRGFGVHDNFINISRFCNTSPHIFATASFDHACRVWDLRQPLTQATAVKTLHTAGRNVMCIFSPDDKYLLCSGVDTRMRQFEVPSWAEAPEKFALRQPMHEERFRRSTYLANSRFIVTGATEESHLHLMNTQGENLGVINFRGVLARRTKVPQVPHEANPVRLATANFASRLEHWNIGPLFPTGQQPSAARQPAAWPQGHVPKRALITGHVLQRDLESRGTIAGSTPDEFVQSIRAHPTRQNRVGVLLSHMNGEHSHVAMVDLDPQSFC